MSCYLRFKKKKKSQISLSNPIGEELKKCSIRANIRQRSSAHTYENLAVSLEKKQTISIFQDLLARTKVESLVTFGHFQLSSEI